MGKTTGTAGALDVCSGAHAAREASIPAGVRAGTAKPGSDAVMQTGPEQVAFMGRPAKLMGARRVIEFGSFTGYSSLALALAGAERITCAAVSKKFTGIARLYWQ
ncbi:MAG: hypothetical protein IOC82_16650 [Aestuariivirga sp.]|nr:hypothetical protein [Aestuariivirga sp.]